MGSLNDPDAVGQSGIPGHGPYMTIYLRLADGRIREALFETYGCPTSRACGSWVTSWAIGRAPEETTVLEPGDLITVLGGIQLGKEHCADLAVSALRNAVDRLNGAGSLQ